MKEIIILIITLLLAALAYSCIKRKKNYYKQYSWFQKRNGANMKKSSWFQKIWEGKKEVPEEKKQDIKEKRIRNDIIGRQIRDTYIVLNEEGRVLKDAREPIRGGSRVIKEIDGTIEGSRVIKDTGGTIEVSRVIKGTGETIEGSRVIKDTDGIMKEGSKVLKYTDGTIKERSRAIKDTSGTIKGTGIIIKDSSRAIIDADRVIKEYSSSNGARRENQLIIKQKLVEDYMEVYQKCEDYRQEENYDKLMMSIIPSIQRCLGLCRYVIAKKDLFPLDPERIITLNASLASKIKEAGFLLNSSGKFVLSTVNFELERSRLLQISQEELKERLRKKKAEVATIHRYHEMKRICKESAPYLFRLQILFEQIIEREEILESYREELMDVCYMIEQIFEQNGFLFLYYEELEEESKIAKSFRNLEDCMYSYPALCKKMERIGYQIYLNLSGCYKENE